MKASPISAILLTLISLGLPACHKNDEHAAHEEHKVVVTTPTVKDVIITQRYVCQIHSRRHIDVCALEGGYLEQIPIKEGQIVKKGELMFKIQPILYQSRLDSDIAEADLIQIEYDTTKNLFDKKIVSDQQLAMVRAKLAKAQAEVKKTQAELNYTNIKAPFDGIVDRLLEQEGSMIDEGEMLTSLSDNDVMWVYFNVAEARYLEYMGDIKDTKDINDAIDDEGDSDIDDDDIDNDDDIDDEDDDEDIDDEVENKYDDGKTDKTIELQLADQSIYPHPGYIAAIEANFNHETGNVAFRADFPNPDHLLRHGQTGNVLIQHTLKNAIVIPQRATYEILDKRYVYVIDDKNVAHQRLIVVEHELEDIFVIKSGLSANDKIVFEGVREVNNGDTIEYELISAEKAISDQKFHAE